MQNVNKKKIIVTGAAGFIGLHLAKSLLNDRYTVLGIDNMNDYYDPSLKQARLNQLTKYSEFSFAKIDIADLKQLDYFFSVFQPDRVVNLAAQAGVRYSLENPHAYIESNVKGFMNILECCRHHKTKGLIYASSSSVYGGNEKIPFSVDDRVDHPISIYAATKKSNELMAHTYSHLYGLHTTGLRFFTVYGPWGRPDMAMNIFANKIHNGESIPVFNHGNMKRDFTYIDDIIAGTRSAIEFNAKNEIYNLGNNNWENLMDMVALLEKSLGEKAIIDFQDIQPGDVEKTYANISKSKQDLEYEPTTSLDIGIPKFIQWFKEYNDI
ncbi:MAG: NAD-dependent epimerase/dehydratase family protein [Candidatus Marinimicrobia bacterium]|nr:NAD-dependent epimerase/dehydratase family protein [Candidatus Neomarinimicrobiota bacterium]